MHPSEVCDGAKDEKDLQFFFLMMESKIGVKVLSHQSRIGTRVFSINLLNTKVLNILNIILIYKWHKLGENGCRFCMTFKDC